MARTETPMAVSKGGDMARMIEQRLFPWEKMPYPKFRFFVLELLGAHVFVVEAKRQIDAINHLREREWRESAPVNRGSHTHTLYNEKFDRNDIYILPGNTKALKNIYSKNLEFYIKNEIK